MNRLRFLQGVVDSSYPGLCNIVGYELLYIGCPLLREIIVSRDLAIKNSTITLQSPTMTRRELSPPVTSQSWLFNESRICGPIEKGEFWNRPGLRTFLQPAKPLLKGLYDPFFAKRLGQTVQVLIATKVCINH